MTSPSTLPHVQEVAAFFATQPMVVAVALGGSQTGRWQDEHSDLDLYVYVNDSVSVEARRAFILPRASKAEIQNTFWEEGDEWDDAQDGQHLDVMYRWTEFIEHERQTLLVEHQGRIGYTTAILANVLHSQVLYDPTGWLGEQIEALRQPYPAALAQAIIRKNWPLLRGAMGSYPRQLESAVQRQDMIAINHRLAAYLASYTDILFAINRTYHPGEKRLMQHLADLPQLPYGWEHQLTHLLKHPDAPDLLQSLETLTDGLDHLLRQQDHAGQDGSPSDS